MPMIAVALINRILLRWVCCLGLRMWEELSLTSLGISPGGRKKGVQDGGSSCHSSIIIFSKSHPWPAGSSETPPTTVLPPSLEKPKQNNCYTFLPTIRLQFGRSHIHIQALAHSPQRTFTRLSGGFEDPLNQVGILGIRDFIMTQSNKLL